MPPVPLSLEGGTRVTGVGVAVTLDLQLHPNELPPRGVTGAQSPPAGWGQSLCSRVTSPPRRLQEGPTPKAGVGRMVPAWSCAPRSPCCENSGDTRIRALLFCVASYLFSLRWLWSQMLSPPAVLAVTALGPVTVRSGETASTGDAGALLSQRRAPPRPPPPASAWQRAPDTATLGALAPWLLLSLSVAP